MLSESLLDLNRFHINIVACFLSFPHRHMVPFEGGYMTCNVTVIALMAYGMSACWYAPVFLNVLSFNF